MRGMRNIVFAVTALTMLPWTPLLGQIERFGGQDQQFGDYWSLTPYQFSIVTVRPTGQPLIPLFEGWFPNPDGTYGLSFSYFNMNNEETFHIPIGPDNFLEPAEYNGMQPTYFMPAAPPGREGEQRHYRHQAVFTVNVPGDFGTDDVVWTLRYKGKTLMVPGRITVEGSRIENLEASTSAPEAPALSFDQGGPAGRGRAGVTMGPLDVRVGDPLPLNVWVDPLSRTEREFKLFWFEHQGPAPVAFADREFDVPAGGGQLTTTATFREPGEYVVRVTSLETLSSMVQHCCYTNNYVKVTVTP
jgi:hypothetical protein